MPESGVQIGLASLRDAGAITTLLVAQLHEHHVDISHPTLARAVEGILLHPERGRILVAVENGRVLGVAALSFMWPLEHGDRSAWLEELYVEPGARERGIGTQLLRAALRVAADSGAVAVDLEVDVDHRRAADLYAREGFQPLPRARWVRRLEPAAPEHRGGSPAEATGGCFCGAIRYRIDAASTDVSHCHCTICRRTTGAPFVTWTTVPAQAFTYTSGAPTEFHSTPHAVRQLCPTCGTALTFRRHDRPDSIDVTVGSMDHPDLVHPTSHVWTTSRLPWLQLSDTLPTHEAEGPAERDDDR